MQQIKITWKTGLEKASTTTTRDSKKQLVKTELYTRWTGSTALQKIRLFVVLTCLSQVLSPSSFFVREWPPTSFFIPFQTCAL